MAQISIQAEEVYLLVTITGELVLTDSQQIKEEVNPVHSYGPAKVSACGS